MKIFEVLRFVAAIDQALVNESFRNLVAGDKFKDASEEEKTKAREVYQELIKNASIKNEFVKGKTGNIDQMIEKTYGSLQEFIDGINGIKTTVEEQAKQKKQSKRDSYNNALQSKQSADAAEYAKYLIGDWYVIPCATAEKAKKAARALTAGLDTRLSDEQIKKTYMVQMTEGGDVKIYKTKDLIEDGLIGENGESTNNEYNYAKLIKPEEGETASGFIPKEVIQIYKQTPFFMQPAWCVTGSDNGEMYFDYTYELTTKEGELAKCIIFISKNYPNLRFCMTIKTVIKNVRFDDPNNISLSNITPIQIVKERKIHEFRDSWQFGGPKDIIRFSEKIAAIEPTLNGVYKEYKNKYTGQSSQTILPGEIADADSINNFGELPDSDYPAKPKYFAMLNLPIQEIKADFNNLVNGRLLFTHCERLEHFNGNMPKLQDAELMFDACKHLKTFTSEVPVLKNAYGMFLKCRELETFNAALPSLSEAQEMFSYCTSLKNFESDLSNLIYGYDMFEHCTTLTNFKIDLPKLVEAHRMFFKCHRLKNFEGDLSNLKVGYEMFNSCEYLKNFEADLSSLTSALRMFKGCALSSSSLDRITSTIKDISGIAMDDKKRYIDLRS